MRSRVIPGSLVTIERRVPVSRLNNVDLPTLGRPTMTSDGSFSLIELNRQTTPATQRDAATVLESLSVSDGSDVLPTTAAIPGCDSDLSAPTSVIPIAPSLRAKRGISLRFTGGRDLRFPLLPFSLSLVKTIAYGWSREFGSVSCFCLL